MKANVRIEARRILVEVEEGLGLLVEDATALLGETRHGAKLIEHGLQPIQCF
jgi:hypothetical protein